ncbi:MULTISPECIES: Ig-like domain-containing protein [Providencia]|uniref:Ig-like domain-containing protein n=1 Tax=Providencia TaxID=586 RepID=UPI0012B669AE|nr:MULTISPECIES: Ig-like domain-containing protein [Providencia]MTC56852.1 LysM peptidoglycan-binding domain-containing protein [Providencia rustigianii]
MNSGSGNHIPHRLKFIAWINIAIQIIFPLASIFTPVAVRAFNEQNDKQHEFLLPKNNRSVFRETQRYTLQVGETAQSIADKYNINLQQLRKLNQFRTFSQNFENLQPGDELDIPMAPLPIVEWDDDKPEIVLPSSASENEIRVAQLASQAGKFFSTNPDQEKTKAFARELLTTAASSYAQDWFNRFGSSQIHLEADKKFSLKNSQIDLLMPWYETEDNLIFSQTSLHRKEGRIETNLGLGARWYGEGQMIGGNTFFDYDISRKHSRLGLGVEYRRDFLKLSANSYHRLSGWRSSRDLADHSARPSNGWDVRAEGWLPSYPHIGGKLTYEQYYGDSVALFGTKNLQQNPYSITAGLNYTPIPLVTFNAEHRQGKASKQDSRFGLQLNYQFGKTWKQHLDPGSVTTFRSLMGNRYDFVSRNNHIVLEYKKNDVIQLNIANSITGYAGEKIPLSFTVASKYGLSHLKWNAETLVAAGGHIVQENGKYSLVLPAYRNDAKSANNYTISAVAIDKKGNISPNTMLRVVVTQPAIYPIKSALTPRKIDLIADGKNTKKLSLSIRDKAGNYIDLAANEIGIEKVVANKTAARSVNSANTANLTTVSGFTRIAAGQYEAILTSGTTPENFVLVSKARNAVFPEIKVSVLADGATTQIAKLMTNISQSQPADGKTPLEIKTQLKDANGNPLINTRVTWSSDKNPNKVSFSSNTTSTDQNGFASTTVTSTLAGDVLITASAGLGESQDLTVTFIPDIKSAMIRPQNFHASQSHTLADGITPNTLTVTVTDASGNIIPNVEVQFATDKGQLTNDKVVTNHQGISETQITSTQSGSATITASVGNHTLNKTLLFSANGQTAKVDYVLPEPKASYIADGRTSVTYTAKVLDTNNNPVSDVDVNWLSNLNGSELHFEKETSKTNAQGIATTSIISNKAGIVIVTASTNGNGQLAVPITFVADKNQAKVATLAINKATIIANGNDKAQLDVIVTDNFGNPVEGIDVLLQANNGATITTLTPFSKTTVDGRVKAELATNQATGDIMVAANVVGSQSQPVAKHIKALADNNTAKVTIVSSTDRVQISQQTPTVILTATVIDDQQNPLIGTPVTWLTNHNRLSTNTTVTDLRGQAKVELSGYISGETQVTAQLMNRQTAHQNIQFMADIPHQQNSVLEIKPQTIVANNHEQATATLILRDQWNNPVLGQNIQWSKNNTGLSLSGARELPNNGEYQVNISGNLAGTFDISAQTGSVTSQKMIGLIADSSTAHLKNINIVGKTTAPADGTNPITLRATVTDATNNPAPAGIAVGWRSDIGELSQPVSLTDNNGIAQITLTSTVAGKGKVAAIVGQSTKETTNQIEFLAGTVSRSASSVTLAVPSIIAATGETNITIMLKDNAGNPLTGLANKIILDYSANLSIATPRFNEISKGVYRGKLSGVKAGSTLIKVKANNVTLDNSVSLTITPDSQTARVRGGITASKTTETVGRSVTYSAIFEDANSNLLGAGVPVFWVGNDNTLLSDNQTMTDTTGRSAIQVQRDTIGEALVSLNLISQNSARAPIVAFVQGALDVSKSSLNLTPSTVTAGKPTTLKLVLKDQFGNPLVNQQTAIHVRKDKNHVVISPVTVVDDGVYQVSVSSEQADTAILSVDIGTQSLPQTKTLTVQGDTANGSISSLMPSVNHMQAGNQTGVTYYATVVDQFNNPLPSIHVSWHLQGKAEPFAHSTVTNAQGVAHVKVTSHQMGQLVMTAVLSSSQNKVATPVQVNAGAVNSQNSTFTASKMDIGPDGIEETILTIKLQDDFGNPLSNEIVTINSNAPNTDFTIARITNNQDGSYTSTATATKQGTVRLTARVGSDIIANPLNIKVDAINPTLRFDNIQKRLTYSSITDNGQVIKGLPAGAAPVWSSDNTSIATVDNQGKVKLKKAGRTKIWARIDGNGVYKSAAANYELEVEKARPNLTLTSNSTISATWADNNNHPIQSAFNHTDAASIPVEYISQDASIAQIDSASGAITQVKPGVTKLTIRSKETEQFLSESQEVTYNLAKARFNIDFAQKEQEITDEKGHFALQNTQITVPSKADIVWTSGADSVVNLEKNGTLKDLAKGEANLIMTVKANDYFEQTSGEYRVKVYTKPAISANIITYGNNGNRQDNTSNWSPVYTDDNLEINWSLNGSSEFDTAATIKAVVTEPNGNTFEYPVTVQAGIQKITLPPKREYFSQSGNLKVTISATGKSSHKLKNEFVVIDTPIQVTSPKEIGQQTLGHKVKYFLEGQTSERNICAYYLTDRTIDLVIAPTMNINTNGRRLLAPIYVKHEILSSEYSGTGAAGISYPEISTPNTNDDYVYSNNDIYRKVLKNNCYENHSGSGNITTTLSFLGSSDELKHHFSWNGKNN